MADKIETTPEPAIDAPGTWGIDRRIPGAAVHYFTYGGPSDTVPKAACTLLDAEIPEEARKLLEQAWALIFPIAKAKAGF